jgi:hypothetical protein
VSATLKHVVGVFLILVSLLLFIVSIAALSEQAGSHLATGVAALAGGSLTIWGAYRLLSVSRAP